MNKGREMKGSGVELDHSLGFITREGVAQWTGNEVMGATYPPTRVVMNFRLGLSTSAVAAQMTDTLPDRAQPGPTRAAALQCAGASCATIAWPYAAVAVEDGSGPEGRTSARRLRVIPLRAEPLAR